MQRIETPAGDPAWWVTRHAEVKALLGDQRLGKAHPSPSTAGWYSKEDVAGRPIGGSDTEYSEHAWWRRAMNKVFSPQNLERMRPTVARVAAGCADRLADQAGPVDLNLAYSTPLTSEVMCVLLGVPDEDVALFRQWTEEGAQATDISRSMAGIRQMLSYVERLVRSRRAEPGDDVVSALLAAGTGSPAVHQGRVVKLVGGMLAFGRETPASVIDWGAMLLLTHPDQRARLQAEPALAAGAVEEVLRLFTPPAATDKGLLRYAHTDLEVGGTAVAAGDMMLLDLVAANHDEDVFPEPDRFDIGREPNPHVSFGHGFYMCNFTRLARAEIGLALTSLFDRLPELRMSEPEQELELRSHLRTGGLAKLPVVW